MHGINLESPFPNPISQRRQEIPISYVAPRTFQLIRLTIKQNGEIKEHIKTAGSDHH